MPRVDHPSLRWRFPPPAVPRRWFRRSLLIGVALTITTSIGIAATIVLGSRDAPGFIDDPRLLDPIAAACTELDDTFDDAGDVDPDTSLSEQADAVRRQNAQLTRFVDSLRDLDPEVVADDEPTRRWIGDWERLLALRTAMERSMSAGRPTAMTAPRDDRGRVITERMEVAASSAGCVVPESLLDDRESRASTV